ncbi:MAG: amidase [Rhizobiaceae bacterium]
MNANDLAFEPLTTLSDRLRRREISPVEVTQAMLDRIGKLDGTYMSYTTVLADRALGQARQAETDIMRGNWRGPLHGVPIGIKDLCFTTYAPTTGGTMIHRSFTPDFNATVVDRLEMSGAVTLGKLKMTEGAYTSHHPDDPSPRNPWDPASWVGSSSTGSGVATSAGMCYASLGSDTGGSIRFPSATCGLTGIKPTWGRVSRHGVFALADSLDHVGPMCRTAADAGAVLSVIAGQDANDPTALPDPVPDYLAELGRNIRGLTIGIDRRYTTNGIDPEVVAALQESERVLAALGAKIREVRFPDYEKLVSLWIPMCSIETAIAHKENYPKRASEYGPDLRQLMDQGRSLTGLEVGEIMHERLKFCGALAALFRDVDLLLVPAMPMPIPTLAQMASYGEDPSVLNGILRFTAPFDFSGSPTITMPNGIDKRGMPLSFQLVGRHVSEDVLVRAGHAYQTATDWHMKRPPALAS